VDVTVTTRAGTSAISAASRFAYGAAAIDVPTLGEWSMMALGLMLAGVGYVVLRWRFARVE
ncbi:MAG: IPTL-CTERM sorting domain-containing protein, partial [Bryobacteraceae bacterium]|nr:IPTL-CTERM sorting domain-containing protein [Bryobacteraceae bacterium]